LIVNLAQRQTLLQLLARLAFTLNLAQRNGEHLRRAALRDDNDSVIISEDIVARVNKHAGTFGRLVYCHDLPAPRRVQWRNAAMIDLETQIADVFDVTDQAVRHTACRTTVARSGGEQLTPWSDAFGRPRATENGDLAGLQVIDQLDFK